MESEAPRSADYGILVASAMRAASSRRSRAPALRPGAEAPLSDRSSVVRALVTGGAGFLGRAIVGHLRDRGVSVRVLDLARHPDPAVESLVGDVTDAEAARRACDGVDTVFHAAAMIDWSLNKREALHRVNAGGTARVVEACQDAGVRRLVHTSTVDVVATGRPIDGGDETLPYPSRHLDHYGESKAVAERAVLAANGVRGLATCALRVANLWGPGDPILVPRFVAMARRGRLTALGDGSARYSHVYVTNAAHAHACAAEAIGRAPGAAGEAYFIVDPPPANFFDFLTPILEGAGLPGRFRRVPAWPLRPVAWAWENANRLNLTGPHPPLLTRFTLAQTTQHFWFRTDKAQRLLGYEPPVPRDRAIEETASWVRGELLAAPA